MCVYTLCHAGVQAPPRRGREREDAFMGMGASDVSQPWAGGPRASPRQPLRSRPLPTRARERGLVVRTRAGWASARGPSDARRARQLARTHRARERARGSRVRARARLQEELRRALICTSARRSPRAADERADGASRSAQLGRSPRRRSRPSAEASVRRGQRAHFGAPTSHRMVRG